MEYTISEFKADQDLFNDITGASNQFSKKDLISQMNIIEEEINEMWDALEVDDTVALLDGTIDSLYTILGMLQKLQNMGIDIKGAMYKVAKDNLNKFPVSGTTAQSSADYYQNNGIECSVYTYQNYQGIRYVVRDSSGKIRKPIDFVPTDLTAFVPLQRRVIK